MSFFKVQGLNKSYGKTIVLKDISFSLPSRGMIALIGESGSGKSTLLKCMIGLEPLDSGSIYFNNKLITKFDSFRNKYTSIIFQNYNLISFLNGEDNIKIFNSLRKDKKKNINKLIKEFGLNNKLKQDVNTLSGGEKQRFSILRSVASSPKIIFCDEVTGSLDEENAQRVMNILKELSSEYLIVLVTHNKDYLDKYCDAYIEIENHRIKENTIKEEKEKIKIKENHFSFLNIKSLFKLSFFSLLKNKTKLILSLVSLSLSISLFVVGYNATSNIEKIVKNNKTLFLDYNLMNVSIEKETKIENSSFSLVKVNRPTYSDIQYLLPYFDFEEFRCDYSNVFSVYPTINYPLGSRNYLSNIAFKPYSSLMEERLKDNIEGRFPSRNTFLEVIVNKEAYKLLSDKEFNICIDKQIEYKEDNEIIKDTLSFDLDFKVVGVIDEFSLLQTPVIYYQLDALENFFKKVYLPNLSLYLETDISLYDRMNNYFYKDDKLTSNSMILEISDLDNIERKYNLVNGLTLYESKVNLESEDIVKVNMFSNVYSSFKEVLDIFIFITLIISVFLLSLCIFSLITDFKKDIGVLLSLGISKLDIYKMFFIQTLFISFASLINAIIICILSSKLINVICLNSLNIEIMNLLPSSFSIFLTMSILLFISLISNLSSIFGLLKINIGNTIREE